jgi:soluble lytic murein transglycosylase-like protein
METPARSASERPLRLRAAIARAIVVLLFASSVAATSPPVRLSPPPPAPLRQLPALERHADAIREGFAALGAGDSVVAQKRLSSFSYGDRPVEQARLWWLALAQETNRETASARRSLAKLRARGAELAARDDALARLAAIYSDGGFWGESAEVLPELRISARTPADAMRAAEREIAVRLALGDPGAMLSRARGLATISPSDERAPSALALAAALTGATTPIEALTAGQRIERAWQLVDDGETRRATSELDAIEAGAQPAELRASIGLTRAFALRKEGRNSESRKLARSLSIGEGKWLVRARVLDAENASAMLASTEAASWRSWTVKERIGTRRVKVKGRWTTKTLYRNVTKKAKKRDAKTKRSLAVARADATGALERLLEVQQDDAARSVTLRKLATLARDAEDRDALESRITALVAIDSREDHLLQEEWNEAWAAWRAKKLPVARERFGLIQRTWALPAAKRQARYWYARCLERSGEPKEAKRIYDELASVPRDDVYAVFARSRGGKPAAGKGPATPIVPLDDAPPAGLALARELAQLGFGGEARAEVRAAQNDSNRRWAYAILAESHALDGAQLLMANALRRGFPEIGTVDEDRVPERFRAMYYGNPHRELLEKAAAAQGLDPSLVLGLVMQESSGDAAAGSRAGATGLMQLMPSTAKEVSRKAGMSYHESRLTDPEFNAELGTRYLRELLGLMQGDEILALASYNAGIGNVQRWLRASRGAPDDEFLESIPYPETRGYVKRVLFYRSVYRGEVGVTPN